MWTQGVKSLGLVVLAAIVGSGCTGERPSRSDAGSRRETAAASKTSGAGDRADAGVGAALDGDAVGEGGVRVRTTKEGGGYPLYGVALFHNVNIYSEPNSRSPRLGVLRRGARVRLGRAHEGRGCREGQWHPVEPMGYVCSGRTMRVGEEPPPLGFTPTPPALDAPIPYQYGRNYREGIPLYRRPPSAKELRAERDYQAELAAEKAAAAAGPPDGGVVEGPGEGKAQEVEPAPEPEPEASGDEGEGDEEEEEDDRAATGPIATRLKRGFYVTIEATIIHDGRRYVRTSELNYVDAAAIRKRDVPDISGVELGEELTLPIVITYRETKTRRIDGRGRPSAGRELEAFTALPMLGTTKLGGELYYIVGDGEVVTADRTRPIEPTDPPPEVGADEKWIDVNVTHQSLVAYEGGRPVYATLVSTGKRTHETPEGSFRILSKYISTNMADALDADEPYMIEDVPWTMYFNLAIALHGAFWHSSFGRVRSHGCVNLAPADARWLFFWVGPDLPEGWHGVSATDDNPGTRVFVHE